MELVEWNKVPFQKTHQTKLMDICDKYNYEEMLSLLQDILYYGRICQKLQY